MKYVHLIGLILIVVACKERPIEFVHATAKAELITHLDNTVNETSGLIKFNNTLWTINDSDKPNEIYQISDSTGGVLKTLKINNAKNIDWEDLAQDEDFIYISDTGNNYGNRSSYSIYVIYKNDLIQNTSSVTPIELKYRYQNQPKILVPYSHDFDCEALAVVNNEMILFSKNWLSNNSNQYKINKFGVAKKIRTIPINGLITGADYSSVEDKLFLIGYKSINMVFFPFIVTIDHFSKPRKQIYTLAKLPELRGLQTESIFYDGESILISNEENEVGKQALYKITISNNLTNSPNKND